MTATATTTTTGNASKHPFPPPPSPPSSAVERSGTTATTNPTHLPDFVLPVLKAWGQQRVLRSVKVGDDQQEGGVARAKSPSCSSTFPAKIQSHLRDGAAERSNGDRHAKRPSPKVLEEEEEEDAGLNVPASDMPWSLRTRHGSYTRPPGSAGGTSPAAAGPARPHYVRDSPVEDEDDGEEGCRRAKNSQRPLFSVTLSKVEIEYDVFALTGRRAARRPKKRPRALKRQLDMLFPGYCLSEAAAESYDVPEPPPPPPQPDA